MTAYETFINKDLIHFSNRNLERSIPHICDGLKESTRKILYACLKRNLFHSEIKVAQLAGSVSELTAYHHGENSLQEAIIGMAQIFVGTSCLLIILSITLLQHLFLKKSENCQDILNKKDERKLF